MMSGMPQKIVDANMHMSVLRQPIYDCLDHRDYPIFLHHSLDQLVSKMCFQNVT